MLKKILKSHISADKLDEMYDIELKESENSLIFELIENQNSKSIPLLKKFLILKNRENKKEISKEISKSVAISGEEVKDFEDGVIDVYLRFRLAKKTMQIRSKFLKQHEEKSLIDGENKFILETYPTVNKKLSFIKREGILKAYLESVEKNEEYLRFYGKIKIQKNAEFNKIEVCAEKNQTDSFIFPCEWEEDGEFYKFNFKIISNHLSDDLKDLESIVPYFLKLILKNDEETIDRDMLHSNKLASFEKEADDYIEKLKIKDLSINGNNIYLLLFSTKNRELGFYILSEELCKTFIKKAKNLDKYKIFKENTPIDENLVFFESFHGKYNNSPKYIYEKLLELGYDKKFKFVWSFKDEDSKTKDMIPGSPILVNDDEEEYYKYLASSKYKVNNATFLKILDEREDIIYLQTWHGTPLKKLGRDIHVKDPGVSWTHFNNEVKTWNYLISANDFSTKTFKRAFNYKNKVLELGYPANDLFYQDNEMEINVLKDRFGIQHDKKIILYAPTFRDNKIDDEGNRVFDLELDLNKLYNQLNDKYFLILKTHYVVSQEMEIEEKMKDFIMDLSSHDDIHELFLLSDILITDYSSVFFDYAHSKRPILFFMPDLEDYIESRGVYEEVLESLPGPIVRDNDELIECLNDIDNVEKEYLGKYEEFYNSYCDKGHGDATERIIEEVFGKLKD